MQINGTPEDRAEVKIQNLRQNDFPEHVSNHINKITNSQQNVVES